MNNRDLAKEMLLNALLISSREKRIYTEAFCYGEMKLIGYLYFIKDGVSPGELSEILDVTTARIAALLKSLEIKGLLYRDTDLSDKRRIAAYLTEKGRQSFSDANDGFIDYMERIFELLGNNDSSEYVRISKRISEITHQIRINEPVK